MSGDILPVKAFAILNYQTPKLNLNKGIYDTEYPINYLIYVFQGKITSFFGCVTE
jgi:hypothetical protein